MTRQRLSRAAAIVSGFAAFWAVGVLWTGGAVFYLGPVRFSSRGIRNSVALALLSAVVAWLLGPSGQRRHALAAEWTWFAGTAERLFRTIPRPAHTIAGIAAVGVVVVGLAEGAFVVGGADSYGYVSQAHLWTIGQLRHQPALLSELAPSVSLEMVTPLGYRPSVDGRTIAPTYSPGLPMVMAVFERLFGPRAVFWVVPILGGVLVWATYLIGVRVQGPAVGALAAVLVATSPPFLMQLTAAPMSDLATTAWWTLAIALASLGGRASAFGAGLCAGLAILTRPNLAPLAVIPGGLLMWLSVAHPRSVRHAVQQALLFAAAVIPACVTVGIVNARLWGSPLASGYGSLSDLFGFEHIWPNLVLYPRVIATQMPVVLFLLAAPIVRWRRREGPDRSSDRTMTIALWSTIVVIGLAYLAYPPFDASWNLRFLLPAIPPLLVLASVAALSLADRLIERHTLACAFVIAALGGYGVNYARDRNAFRMDHVQRYALAGEFARQLPERAVLLAMLHSGSATYYSGRPTIRYDLVPPERLDGLIEELQQRGYVPYLLVDLEERAGFQSQYRGYSRLAALDWPPLAAKSPDVQIYALPESTSQQ